jgi:hypothetical protein
MQPHDAIALLKNDFSTTLLPDTIQIVIFFSPIILCIILGTTFWTLWKRYINAKFYNSLKYTVLELRLPKETVKSPAAMEVVLTSMHNTSDGGWTTKFWKGEYRPYYSLELVSIEGQIKFFIWTEDRRKGGVMSTLYSQFPGIEIYEREDYTTGVTFDPKVTKLWAAEFVHTGELGLPIKTYVDYGLDKDPKEEYKVDPMTPMIEFLGSMPINQHLWIQIMIRAHKKEQNKPGHWFDKEDPWKNNAEKMINEMMMRDPKTKVAGFVDDNGRVTQVKNSPYEDEVLNALQRSLSKLPYDVGIRVIYMAPKDQFNTPFGIGGTISSFKQFSTQHLNGLRPNSKKWIVQLDEPWKDYKDYRRNELSKLALQAYKRRSLFHQPFQDTALVMNSEELATIYHFPGSVAATPGLERVPSKKAEAPANLPL